MLSLFQSFIPSIRATFNELSKPSAKHITDKEEFERDHDRNKTVLLVHGSAFFQFFINLIIGNGDLPATLQGLIGTSCVIIVLCLSARFNLHPQIFKSVYNVYVVSFGMMFIQSSENGIIGACMAAPLFPIIVYFLTGSIAHFWFHTFCQILLINTFYQGLIRNSLQSLSLDRAPMDFTYFANQSMVYSLISTAFMHYTMKNAFIKAKIAEMKKEEFQKQKNFLLGFSHELRNLINSLMGNVKLCLLQNPPEKIKDLLINAEVCAELLLHSVNNILDTGKAEIGDLEINPVPARIYDTLERIWSVCSELIKRRNLRGRIKIQRDIPQIVEIDHYRITQIFLNLVGNAAKYTDSGAVDITVEWLADQDMREKCFEPYPFNEANDQDEGIFEKTQTMSILNPNFIFLSFSKRKIDMNILRGSNSDKKGVLKISVTDTGCGIVKEDLGKLFQMFTQGTIDPSKKKLGTGLGLFITKELCNRMGGDVKVFSKRGMGSAFILCIPIQPIATERAFFFNLEGIHNAINHRRLRAMIVDDEQFAQHILRDFLIKLNVDVVDIAENGLIAYKRFEDRQRRKDYVNIVTMDLQMPLMDGKLAAQKIREIEANHNLEPSLMIIISANCSESEIVECLDKNGRIKADAFVKKPVSIDELCRIISSHFAMSYDRQRVRLLND